MFRVHQYPTITILTFDLDQWPRVRMGLSSQMDSLRQRQAAGGVRAP